MSGIVDMDMAENVNMDMDIGIHLDFEIERTWKIYIAGYH
jgi:hypothetical protein